MSIISNFIVSNVSSLWKSATPLKRFVAGAAFAGIILNYPYVSLAAGASLFWMKKNVLPSTPEIKSVEAPPLPVIAEPVAPIVAPPPAPKLPQQSRSHLIAAFSLTRLIQLSRGEALFNKGRVAEGICGQILVEAEAYKQDFFTLLNDLLCGEYLVSQEQLVELDASVGVGLFREVRGVLFPYLKGNREVIATIKKGEGAISFLVEKTGSVSAISEDPNYPGTLRYQSYKTLLDFANSLVLRGEGPATLQAFTAGPNINQPFLV